MAEKRTKVHTYQVEYECEAEGCTGKLMFMNRIKQSMDPKDPFKIHICMKCKKIYELKGTPYPRQEFEPVIELELHSGN